VQSGVIQGIAHTIQTMFLIGVPIAFVAFLLSWTLPELTLRKSIRTSEPGEQLGTPAPRTSLEEVRLQLERAANRENRAELYGRLATRAGLDLQPRLVWLLYRLADRPESTLEEVCSQLKVDPDRLHEGVDLLVAEGMVERAGRESGVGGGPTLVLTADGHEAIEKLTIARRQSLTEVLEGWDPEDHPEVIEMVRDLARALLADDDKLLADAWPTPTGTRAP
jgi:DNA-binding MarR family transcriptional regulator